MSIADASSVCAVGKAAPAKSHSALQWLDFLKELLRLLFNTVEGGILVYQYHLVMKEENKCNSLYVFIQYFDIRYTF